MYHFDDRGDKIKNSYNLLAISFIQRIMIDWQEKL